MNVVVFGSAIAALTRHQARVVPGVTLAERPEILDVVVSTQPVARANNFERQVSAVTTGFVPNALEGARRPFFDLCSTIGPHQQGNKSPDDIERGSRLAAKLSVDQVANLSPRVGQGVPG